MRKNIFIVFLLVLISNTAYADTFQFFKLFKDYKGPMAYCTVVVGKNKVVFKGITDRYGRVKIRIPNGRYLCTIMHLRKKYKTYIVIKGNKTIKIKTF